MTRSKAPLARMEQMVMLRVFALAAALCLQAFVKSDGMSKRGEARDRAVVLAQTAAEAVRACGGDFEEAAQLLGAEDWDEESITLNYNSGWEPVSPGGSGLHYMLSVGRMDDSGVPGMGKAVVYVKDLTILSADDGLFRIEVAWQEVSAHD